MEEACLNTQTSKKAFGLNMYAKFYDDFATYMVELPDKDKRKLASDLTSLFNLSLLNNERITETDLPQITTQLKESLIGHKATSQLVGLPWAVYSKGKAENSFVYTPYVEQAQLLVSLPQEISFNLDVQQKFSGIYYGSLINYIADMIANAKRSVIISSPYWRRAAIDAILSRLPKNFHSPASFKIITSANLPDKDKDGLDYFVYCLNNIGIFPKIGIPDKQENQRYPLMHAKTVVCDGSNAYIGSANFTQSGMQNNFEIGIGIKGTFVRTLHEWIGVFFDQLIIK